MIYLLYQNHRFQQAIEYTFRVFMSIYGIEWKAAKYNQPEKLQSRKDDILISYGEEKPSISSRNHLHIYESGLFGENYLKPESLPTPPLARFDQLPIIYQSKGQIPQHVATRVSPDDHTIETDIDIIASSFFMLARYEEVLLDKRDEQGRFPARESLAYKESFLDHPIVNEYAELLWDWLQSLNPRIKRVPPWPGNKQFAICQTHDVDTVRKYHSPPIITIAGLLLKERNPRCALSLAWDYIKVLLHLREDPFDTFDYMLRTEQEHGIKSSFYFMSARDEAYNPHYSVNETGILNLIKSIEDRGGEVGLHTGYNSYNNHDRISLEKDRLDGVVSNQRYGCRQHGLRFRCPDTWRHQEKAGLLYDASLGFADNVGFRAGICFPFKPFDVIENKELDIWELPLEVMEVSLQNINYQNLSPGESYEEIIKHIKMVKRFSGVFVILWHNSSFHPLGGWEGWAEVYEQLMKYIGEQDAFTTNGREIIEQWEARAIGAEPWPG